MGRSIVPGSSVTLVNRQNPLLPVPSFAYSIDTIVPGEELDVWRLPADGANSVNIFRERLDAVEILQDMQKHEALRVHLLPQEDVLAQVVHREVILPLPSQREVLTRRIMTYIWVCSTEGKDIGSMKPG